jgi:hypothetical protein
MKRPPISHNVARVERVRQLAAQGLTQRAISAKMAEEGSPFSQAMVCRALRALPPRPGHEGRRGERKPKSTLDPSPKKSKAPSRTSQGDESKIPLGLELADYLEDEVSDLFEQGKRLREADGGIATVDARVKVLKAIADLGERVRALRPPPPIDPNTQPDIIAEAAELTREFERLVALAEGERAA